MLDLRAPKPGRPFVIAHRGASGEAPENTMAAFDLAIRQGADVIELDVHVTADSALIVMHDFAVDRTTDGHGLIKDLKLADVRSLDASARSSLATAAQQVPTLDEVLDWAHGRVPVAIEVKSGPIRYAGIESKIAQRIAHHSMADEVVVISFDHSLLLRMKKVDRRIATGVLYACAPVEPSTLAMAAHADVLLPHWADLNGAMVEDAHECGLAISTWAVDDERDIGWVVSLGVDAVATNFPERMARIVKTRPES